MFLAFELGWKEWKPGFSTGLGQKARQRTIPPRALGALGFEIETAKKRFKVSKATRVVSCYEAGRDGFWLHRCLVDSGIENPVVDSSSIELNRRARRAKTDGSDVQKLLTMLMRYHWGETRVWRVVRVPSAQEEDARQLHREMRTLKKERTRTTNRIKGLLANHGIRMQRPLNLCGDGIERLRLWDGSGLPSGLMGRVSREWQHVEFLHRQILALEAQRRRLLSERSQEGVEKIRRLVQLRAIGPTGAWVLVQEFFGWRKFRNRKQVGSLAGLTSTPFQSGDGDREQGISKAGNRHIRAVAIELAWSWLRYQPQSRLSRWHRKRFADAGGRARRIGIVAAARRLLIDLWRFLETGVLPAGAQLKP